MMSAQGIWCADITTATKCFLVFHGIGIVALIRQIVIVRPQMLQVNLAAVYPNPAKKTLETAILTRNAKEIRYADTVTAKQFLRISQLIGIAVLTA